MTQNAKNTKRVCYEKVAKKWRICGESREILVAFVAILVVAYKNRPPHGTHIQRREGVSTSKMER